MSYIIEGEISAVIIYMRVNVYRYIFLVIGAAPLRWVDLGGGDSY